MSLGAPATRKQDSSTPPGTWRKEWLAVVLLWALISAVGWAIAASTTPLPRNYSVEGEVSDEAFRLLVFLGVPVFAFVVSVLLVTVVKFRHKGEIGSEDGPPLRATPLASILWLVVTGSLAIFVIVNPGLVGLAKIRSSGGHGAHGAGDADLVVEVDSARWSWTVTYPDYGITVRDELVLPVDSRIRFDVTSRDVLHSFWIPAFRVKIDAVPGKTTVAYARPTEVGSQAEDSGLRLQCAELCGLGHAQMAIPVRVVERAEFEAWAQARSQQADARSAG